MDDAALDALLDEFGTWDDAAAFLELTAESSEGAERARALVSLGYVRARHMDDPAGALTAWDALSDDDAPDDDPFAEAWADACEATGRYEDAAATHIDRGSALAEPAARSRALARAARLYLDHLAQPDHAALILRRATTEYPSDDVLDLVEQVGLGDPESAADTLRRAAGVVAESDGPAAAAAVQARLGRWLADQLGAYEEAIARWEAAADVDPTLDDVVKRLAAALDAADDSAGAITWLQRGFDAAIGHETRADLGTRLADGLLASDRASEAATVLASCLSDAPDDDSVADALAKALAQAEDWKALALHHRDRAARTAAEDPARSAAHELALADVLALRCDDAGGAHDALRRARSRADGPDVRERLAESAASLELWRELADLLRDRVDDAPDDASRAALLLRQADVRYDHLGDVDGAIAAARDGIAVADTEPDLHARLTTWLRDAQRWPELAAALEAYADAAAADDPAPLIEAAAIRGRLEDRAAAVDLLERALQRAPDSVDALTALAEIHEARGDVGAALPLRERLASTGPEDGPALARVARLKATAGDPGAADAYRAAIAALPRNAELHRELATVLVEAGDAAGAIAVLQLGGAQAGSLVDRASLHVFAAELELDVAHDTERALAAYERAWELDPVNVRAAAGLADLYVAASLWERIPPLIPVLLADPRYQSSGTDAARVHALEGLAQSELGRYDIASEAWARAVEADTDDPALRVAWAESLARAGRDAEAGAAYEGLDPSKLAEFVEHPAETCVDAARAWRAAGDLEGATSWYNYALDWDATHAVALRERAALDTERAGDDPIARLQAQERQLQATPDPLARFALLCAIGDGHALLGDVDRALDAWRDAAEAGVDPRAPLRRALALSIEVERWADASAFVDLLAGHEDDPVRRARLRMTNGALQRDHLDDPARAVAYFEACLEDDPTRVEALDAISAIHRAREQWGELQRTLRRAIERVARDETDDGRHRRHALCVELADVLADHLGRVDEARAALQIAAAIDPDDAHVLERITQLYPSTGKSDADVIGERLALLRVRPDHIDSYHLLYSALKRSRQLDFAWRVAGILRASGHAEPAESAWYDELRPPRVPTATSTLGPESWPQLAHHEVDFLLSRLFAALAPVIGPAYATSPRQLGIQPRRHSLPISGAVPLTSLVRYASTTLGVAEPELYQHDGGSGLRSANLWPPAMLVGPEMLEAVPNRALAFRVARAVTLMRPEYQLASAWRATAPLKTFVYGAISAFTGTVVDPRNAEAVAACARTIRESTDQQQAAVWGAVQAALQANAPLDVGRWLRGVEFTASRAGLLLCGDLERAIEAMRAVPEPAAGAELADRIADLVAWSLTRGCEDLRAGLGLGIGQQ